MSEIKLELGDIIQIESPSNPVLDDKIFMIYYIDDSLMRLLNTVDLEFNDLNIEDNRLLDESIKTISILRKEDKKGYARQHNLLPKTWVEIKFGGDIPAIIVAEITDLQEDMIELTSYPDSEVFYIDFAYKGIPLDIPLEQIQIRDEPIKEIIDGEEKELEIKRIIDDEDVIEQDDEDVMVLTVAKKDVALQLGDVLAEAEDIMFGDVEDVTQEVQVSESEKRFSLEEQTNDLLDEMLSTIPNLERTKKVLSRINRMINRFTQLREKYSSTDDNGVINGLIKKTSNYKPLVRSLKKLNHNLYWLLPIVKNKREIFDVLPEDGNIEININEDIIPRQSISMVERLTKIISDYKDGSQIESTNSYSSFIKTLTGEMDTYELPTENESLYVDKVNTNLNVIFDNVQKNLEDFYSSVYRKESFKKARYVISKYGMGLDMLKADEIRGSRMKARRIPLTNNDSISLKGFIKLPQKFVEYSKINLPGTTIYDKTNLNQSNLTYWNILKRNTSIVKTTVDSDIDYNKSQFINTMNSFVMNDDILERENVTARDKEQHYMKFLTSFIPTTLDLFNTYKQHINNGLSVDAVVKQMEPFLIYRDDLTYKHYVALSEFIEDNILKLKQRLVVNTKDTNILRNLKARVNFVNGLLLSIIETNKENIARLYQLNSSPVFDSELYSKFMMSDYGRYYNTIIRYDTRDLNVNPDVERILNNSLENIESKIQSDTNMNDCNTRELTKLYLALDELNIDDSNDEVYYDKKYDTTNYEFIKEYNTERVSLNPDEFKEFLVSKLVDHIGMSPKLAEYEAESMIQGKKRVIPGNYAILLEDDGASKFYYKRESNRWVLDPSIDIKDDSMFCNTSDKCLTIKDDCLDINEAKKQILKKTLENISSSLEKDNTQITESLDQQLLINGHFLSGYVELRSRERLHNNNMMYSIGNYNALGEQIITSPYAELVDMILAQRDLAKKMNDINTFVLNYTRFPEGEEESIYWYYCNETGVKLLPTFYAVLSNVFLSDGNYLEALDTICAERGKLSDDGDKWVDEHSGYMIKMVDFANEDGFDDAGFRVETNAVLDDITDTMIENVPSEGGELFNTKEAVIIKNIFYALMLYSGVELGDSINEMVKGTLVNSMKQIGSRTVYDKKVKALELKGKKMISYDNKRNQLFLIFSGIYFLIYLQTAIPGVRTRKTFPGCIKSFEGFPFSKGEEMGGLNYIACIMKKISSSQSPWNSIKGVGESSFAKNMAVIYDKILSIDSIINQRIKAKELYLETNDGGVDFIPDDVDVSNWNTFLPPLNEITIGKVADIAPDFKKDLTAAIKRGSFKQVPMLSTLESKILYMSLYIQEEIEKIVQKQDSILTTSTGTPYIQNMCCNIENNSGTLKYFTDKSEKIMEYNSKIERLREMHSYVMDIGKSVILFDKTNTRRAMPVISSNFGEKTIYQGFIKHCNINDDKPIHSSLESLCLSRTSEFNKFDSLSEKIEILKKEGREYNNDMFIELLNIVNRQHVMNINFERIIPSTTEKLLETIMNIKNDSENGKPINVSEPLVKILESMIPDINNFKSDMHSDTKKMLNYTIVSVNNIKKNIMKYISRHSNKSRIEKKHINTFIETFEEFNKIVDTDMMTSRENTSLKVIEFIKNSIYYIVNEYPNIILNQVNYHDIVSPKHWNLSQKHSSDLTNVIRGNYKDLVQYYGNSDLEPLLGEIANLSKHIINLVENTPAVSSKDVKHSSFDLYTIQTLYVFYFFSILEKFVELESLAIDEEYAVIDGRTVSSTEYADNTQTEQDEGNDETLYKPDQDVLEGNKVQVQKYISSLLGTFLLALKRQKERVNLNREMIMELIVRSKEKEKNTKTRQLKDLTDEERKVDGELRKAKLGKWNVGLQKGLTRYVKSFYDNERDAMDNEAIINKKLDINGDVNKLNRDIYEEDIREEQDADLEADFEAYDMSMFADDDDFEDRDGDEQY